MKMLGAIDQGTSSTRFIVFNLNGDVVSSHQLDFPQIHPHPGWTEHDPKVIMNTVYTCIEEVAKDLSAKGHSIKDLKGWKLNVSCAVKLRWMLDHVEEVKKAQDENRLMFGTIDSWLIYNLTGGKEGGMHVTDITNASRTMLMNLHTLKWDNDLLEFFGASESSLPEIKSSAETYGFFASGPLKGIPIAGCLGDQQSALVGHRCFDVGNLKNTYGTGCFMLFNTGEIPVISTHGLLTTVGYKLGQDARTHYALEGSISIAGAAVKWLRDNLGIIKEAAEINTLAEKVKDAGGVYFVPAFQGLFAPYWRDDARGCIVGLTQYTTKEHIARAVLEAICYQTCELVEAMNLDSGRNLTVIKVDGGLTNSDLCMQIQADTTGINVERPLMREMTALGAAIAAGIGCGVWGSADDARSHLMSESQADIFTATSTEEDRKNNILQWKKAVKKSFE
ncbi:Glycerol kinase [Nowakowskiella sp. JEL0407]|nr:Glycerol kinase [Nowakowskiella sp. JEL0407]